MCVWEVTELSFSFTYNHRRTMKTRKERGSDTGKSSYEIREGGRLYCWRKEGQRKAHRR